MRIVVAMSGGVDSSAAAALLKEQGHEVLGITLRVWSYEGKAQCGSCCSPEDIDDARAVAQTLGIPFYVANAESLFKERVVTPFVQSYLSGRTPIPCVACNRDLKFDFLLTRARALGQQALADIVFPVGELTKAQVREVAERHRLPTSKKPESMEICFVPDGDYAKFVERIAGPQSPGEIVDRSGTKLGTHPGIHHYTIGQRKGLRLGSPQPLYVQRLDAARQQVVVGPLQEVERSSFEVLRPHWVSEPPSPEQRIEVRIRHRHSGAGARVKVDPDGAVRVSLESPVRAVTPGQAAVFYEGGRVLGGGWIS